MNAFVSRERPQLALPVGAVIQAIVAPDATMLPCDGSALSKSNYNLLWQQLKHRYTGAVVVDMRSGSGSAGATANAPTMAALYNGKLYWMVGGSSVATAAQFLTKFDLATYTSSVAQAGDATNPPSTRGWIARISATIAMVVPMNGGTANAAPSNSWSYTTNGGSSWSLAINSNVNWSGATVNAARVMNGIVFIGNDGGGNAVPALSSSTGSSLVSCTATFTNGDSIFGFAYDATRNQYWAAGMGAGSSTSFLTLNGNTSGSTTAWARNATAVTSGYYPRSHGQVVNGVIAFPTNSAGVLYSADGGTSWQGVAFSGIDASIPAGTSAHLFATNNLFRALGFYNQRYLRVWSSPNAAVWSKTSEIDLFDLIAPKLDMLFPATVGARGVVGDSIVSSVRSATLASGFDASQVLTRYDNNGGWYEIPITFSLGLRGASSTLSYHALIVTKDFENFYLMTPQSNSWMNIGVAVPGLMCMTSTGFMSAIMSNYSLPALQPFGNQTGGVANSGTTYNYEISTYAGVGVIDPATQFMLPVKPGYYVKAKS